LLSAEPSALFPDLLSAQRTPSGFALCLGR
jgi:hypothetical protein